jgi:hypothetical protein
VGWDYILEKPVPLRVAEFEKIYYDERQKAVRGRKPA